MFWDRLGVSPIAGRQVETTGERSGLSGAHPSHAWARHGCSDVSSDQAGRKQTNVSGGS